MIEPEFLIDSNIAICILVDGRSAPALRLAECRQGSVVTSAIVYAEVMRGIPARETEAVKVANRLFDIVPVIPFEVEAARHYARLPFRRGSFDRLIAAHALSLGLTLVTNNEGDFADIPGLRVQNWTV